MSEQINALIIHNVRLVLEHEVAQGSVEVRDGAIAAIRRDGVSSVAVDQSAPQVEVIDGNGGWLLPGFIDLHVHGGFGGDFMHADRDSYDRITRFHASRGTTGMLATTVTASKEAIDAALKAVSAYREQGMAYAPLLGVHLEGPFISERWPGAQNPAHIRDPQLAWLQQWNKRYPGLIKLVTLAPEKKGAKETISWLAGQGIIAAAGHTDALYEEIRSAADCGLSHAVHTYNAMRGLHHREPGTLGAVMTTDSIFAEIIADGEHVQPAAIKLLLAAKPKDKVVLITDAIEAAGMPDGDYELGGLAVVVNNGVARLRDGGALAGSSLTMIAAFRFMVERLGLSPVDASRMASGNPARRLGLGDSTGAIAVGKQADLVLTDGNFHVVRTLVRGRTVFAEDSRY